jgi:hypothetical protein
MSWLRRGWFGASWFGRWFGAEPVTDPWSGKIPAEITLTTAPVDVFLGERYALRIAVETAELSISVRS